MPWAVGLGGDDPSDDDPVEEPAATEAPVATGGRDRKRRRLLDERDYTVDDPAPPEGERVIDGADLAGGQHLMDDGPAAHCPALEYSEHFGMFLQAGIAAPTEAEAAVYQRRKQVLLSAKAVLGRARGLGRCTVHAVVAPSATYHGLHHSDGRIFVNLVMERDEPEMTVLLVHELAHEKHDLHDWGFNHEQGDIFADVLREVTSAGASSAAASSSTD